MIIANDEEHGVMLELLGDLMDRTPCSLAIGIVGKVIEEYELVRWPPSEPTPEEAAAFRAEQEAGTLCSCEGAAVCGVAGGYKKEPLVGLCRALVCEKRGHLLVQKLTAVICDRCRVAVQEK